jgi:hypothetical protein
MWPLNEFCKVANLFNVFEETLFEGHSKTETRLKGGKKP